MTNVASKELNNFQGVEGVKEKIALRHSEKGVKDKLKKGLKHGKEGVKAW